MGFHEVLMNVWFWVNKSPASFWWNFPETLVYEGVGGFWELVTHNVLYLDGFSGIHFISIC